MFCSLTTNDGLVVLSLASALVWALFSCCAAPSHESAAEGYVEGIKLGGADTSYNTAKSLPRPSENDLCFEDLFCFFCEGLNTRVMARGWDKICSLSAYYSCSYRPCANNTTSAKSTSSGAPSVDWTPYTASLCHVGIFSSAPSTSTFKTNVESPVLGQMCAGNGPKSLWCSL